MSELASEQDRRTSGSNVSITEQLKGIESVKIFFTDLNGRLKNLDVNPDNIFLNNGFAYLGNFGKSYFTDHNRTSGFPRAALSTTVYSPVTYFPGL